MRWPVSIRVFRVHLPVSALKPCLLCHPPHAVAGLPRSYRHTTTHAPVPGAPTTPSRRAAQCQNLMHLFAGHPPPHAECRGGGSTPCTVRHVASALAAAIPMGATAKQNPAHHRLPRRNGTRTGRCSGTHRLSPNAPSSLTQRNETRARHRRPRPGCPTTKPNHRPTPTPAAQPRRETAPGDGAPTPRTTGSAAPQRSSRTRTRLPRRLPDRSHAGARCRYCRRRDG